MPQEEEIDMELNGLLNKVTSNGGKIGALFGAWGTLGAFAKEWQPYGVNDPVGAAWNIINSIAVNPHFPNISHAWASAQGHGIIKTGAQGAILGYVLKLLDLDPKVNRIGGFLQDAGVATVFSAGAVELLTYSGAGNSPSYPRGQDNTRSGPRSALAQAYGAN